MYKVIIVSSCKMVDVKLSLVKRDFVWIGFLIALVGVGFVYGYGGNDPAVMGHSEGELEGMATTTYVDFKIQNLQDQITALGGSPSSSLDLVNGFHSSDQCTTLGGVVITLPEGDACKLAGSTCSSYAGSWTQLEDYSETSAHYCISPGAGSGCTTSFHVFSDNPTIETCLYPEYVCTAIVAESGACAVYNWQTTTVCSAPREYVGCY